MNTGARARSKARTILAASTTPRLEISSSMPELLSAKAAKPAPPSSGETPE